MNEVLMNRDEMIKLLHIALHDLLQAAAKMTKETTPVTPLPRPRKFSIIQGVVYPHVDAYGQPQWSWINIRGNGYSLPSYATGYSKVASIIAELTQFQPRGVLRALRRIQAATAWCEARYQGRLRAAQEIMRQQAKAKEALEAELVLHQLGQGKTQ